MPKKIYEMKGRKDIRIPLDVSEAFFKRLNITTTTSYLMDVKKSIFNYYKIPQPPVMTITKPLKTLAQQRPNNAYGIIITDDEVRIFMKLFGFSEDEEFTTISKRIIKDILSQ